MTTKEIGQETEVTEPEKTLTPEEQLAAIQTELSTAQEKLGQTEKGLKTAHQTLTEKDKHLKQIEGERADVAALSAKVEVLGGMISEYLSGQGGTLEETPPEKKIDYTKRFQEIEASARIKSEIAPRQRRAEALGIPMDAPKILTVEYLTTRGRFGEADKLLDDLEAEVAKPKVEEPPEASKETEDERVNRLAEEKALKMMEEKGLLTTETGGPSGASGSDEEFKKKFGSGELPMSKENVERYEKIRKTY